MHYTMMSEERERLEYLYCETSNECRGESCEAVGLDEFVKIDAQELGGDAKMPPEGERFNHLNDIMFVVGILLGGGEYTG